MAPLRKRNDLRRMRRLDPRQSHPLLATWQAAPAEQHSTSTGASGQRHRVGKPAAVFTSSTGTLHRRPASTLPTMLLQPLHHGMLLRWDRPSRSRLRIATCGGGIAPRRATSRAPRRQPRHRRARARKASVRLLGRRAADPCAAPELAAQATACSDRLSPVSAATLHLTSHMRPRRRRQMALRVWPPAFCPRALLLLLTIVARRPTRAPLRVGIPACSISLHHGVVVAGPHQRHARSGWQRRARAPHRWSAIAHRAGSPASPCAAGALGPQQSGRACRRSLAVSGGESPRFRCSRRRSWANQATREGPRALLLTCAAAAVLAGAAAVAGAGAGPVRPARRMPRGANAEAGAASERNRGSSLRDARAKARRLHRADAGPVRDGPLLAACAMARGLRITSRRRSRGCSSSPRLPVPPGQ